MSCKTHQCNDPIKYVKRNRMTTTTKCFISRDLKRKERQQREASLSSSRRDPSFSLNTNPSFPSRLELSRRDARLTSSFLTLAREDEVKQGNSSLDCPKISSSGIFRTIDYRRSLSGGARQAAWPGSPSPPLTTT